MCAKGKCNDECRMQRVYSLPEEGPDNVYCSKSDLGNGIKGLRAGKTFHDGEPIVIYAGDILTTDDLSERREQLKKQGFLTNYQVALGDASTELQKPVYIDCSLRGSIAGMANHHPRANACYKTVRTSLMSSDMLTLFLVSAQWTLGGRDRGCRHY